LAQEGQGHLVRFLLGGLVSLEFQQFVQLGNVALDLVELKKRGRDVPETRQALKLLVRGGGIVPEVGLGGEFL